MFIRTKIGKFVKILRIPRDASMISVIVITKMFLCKHFVISTNIRWWLLLLCSLSRQQKKIKLVERKLRRVFYFSNFTEIVNGSLKKPILYIIWPIKISEEKRLDSLITINLIKWFGTTQFTFIIPIISIF